MKRLRIALLAITCALLGSCGPSLEQQVPGTWQASADLSVMPTLENPFAMFAMGDIFSSNLVVNQDRTFKLNLGPEINGTWKMQGSMLHLTPSEQVELPIPALNLQGMTSRNGNRTLTFYMSGDGRTLSLQLVSMKLVFTKSRA
jgi:hypothetical protein